MIFCSLIPYFTFNGGVVVVLIVWLLDIQLPMKSLPITTNVLSSNPTQARCTRYNIQGCLNNIIGSRAKQSTGAHTYTTTHRNETVNVDKIKHIVIVLVLPTKSVFKH